MNLFTDSPAFLVAKLVSRRDYYEWKASFTDEGWDAHLDALYGPRDSEGRRHVRIEVAK